MINLNKYSKEVTQNPSQPAAQAMLHAIGLTKDDLTKPQIGIVSTGWEGNPCNMHLNGLAEKIKKAINPEEAIGLIFHTIGVSDGISMGTKGMNFSLPSRDIIADSIETVVSAQWYDALIAVVGCDKNMPGALMAMGRLNRPAILFYGGSIAPGCHAGKKLDIVSAFEALGQKNAGQMNTDQYENIIQKACPGPGACGGMYTANTMASAIEIMGMSLPFNSSNPATSNAKNEECSVINSSINNLIQTDLKPRDILTKKSLENAVRLITVLGGSTNAVIHLLAIADAFDIDFSLNEFQQWSNDTPYLADLKPSGQYLMQDLHEIGGIPGVGKLMLDGGLLHGDCITVTGKSIRENLKEVSHLKENKIIHTIQSPIKPNGHIQILHGNLAEEGAVSKITGKEGTFFKGNARVFNSEQEANDAIEQQTIKENDVIVIRYCGPKGGPGMPEMLKPTSLIMGSGLGKKVALITDGRFSGGTHGFVVGHITPEAFDGGMIALIQDNDVITIDIANNAINVDLKDDEIQRRKKNWSPIRDTLRGVLGKYRKTVSSASKGCITC